MLRHGQESICCWNGKRKMRIQWCAALTLLYFPSVDELICRSCFWSIEWSPLNKQPMKNFISAFPSILTNDNDNQHDLNTYNSISRRTFSPTMHTTYNDNDQDNPHLNRSTKTGFCTWTSSSIRSQIEEQYERCHTANLTVLTKHFHFQLFRCVVKTFCAELQFIWMTEKNASISRSLTLSVCLAGNDQQTESLTLRFFHQYLRFNLPALVVNCDAPVCKTSERICFDLELRIIEHRIRESNMRYTSASTTYRHDFPRSLVLNHVRVLFQDYPSSHQQPVQDIHTLNWTTSNNGDGHRWSNENDSPDWHPPADYPFASASDIEQHGMDSQRMDS